MKRRDFVKFCGLFASSSICGHAISVVQYPLNIELIKGEWGNVLLEITKGPYKVISCTANDCKDCHGLCATLEVTHMIVQELELGNENLELIYRTHYDFSEFHMKQRKDWINSLRRFNTSKEEKMQIYNILKKLRGPHNCPLNVV